MSGPSNYAEYYDYLTSDIKDFKPNFDEKHILDNFIRGVRSGSRTVTLLDGISKLDAIQLMTNLIFHFSRKNISANILRLELINVDVNGFPIKSEISLIYEDIIDSVYVYSTNNEKLTREEIFNVQSKASSNNAVRKLGCINHSYIRISSEIFTEEYRHLVPLRICPTHPRIYDILKNKCVSLEEDFDKLNRGLMMAGTTVFFPFHD